MGKFIDMTGWKMWEHNIIDSRLEVIKRVDNDAENKPQWLCKCICGNTVIVRGKSLRNGNTKSCGCYQKEKASANGKTCAKFHSGDHIAMLTLLEPIGKDSTNKTIWKCKCDCGNITHVISSNLGNSTGSCGCSKASIGELNIINYLKANNYNFIYDKPYFKDLKSKKGGILRYDFIILDNDNKPRWLIEFDGRQHKEEASAQWFSQSLSERIENDNIKNQYAISHHLPLVRIPYTQKNNINKDILFGNKYLII